LCGIFGILISENLKVSPKELMQITNYMFKLSESRGKEASGLALRSKGSIYVLKEPITSSRLVKTDKYKNLFNQTLKAEGYSGAQLQAPFLILGHSRLQTNGQSEINTNNQPVVKDGAVGIHNGIIVNDDNLWKLFSAIKKQYDVDTEVFLSLLQMFRSQGKSIMEAVKFVFKYIEGSASVAVEFADSNSLLLASNTGSLYIALSQNEKILVFASEKFILQQILKYPLLSSMFVGKPITQVKAGQGYLFDLTLTRKQAFLLQDNSIAENDDDTSKSKANIFELYDKQTPTLPDPSRYHLHENIKQTMIQNWEALYSSTNVLKRCTRCLLPETMPYINVRDASYLKQCLILVLTMKVFVAIVKTMRPEEITLKVKKHLKSLFLSTGTIQANRMFSSVLVVEETAHLD
jgi:glutamine---fructose-6-phosphate transaminase (isomerizing)